MPKSDRPDLAEGIPQEALTPGQMIEGTYEGALAAGTRPRTRTRPASRSTRYRLNPKSAAEPSRGPIRDRRARSRSVVIVGAGAAGAIAAETLREEGFQGRVTLLDGEPSGPVDRPNLSKDYLAGNAPEEWLPLRSGEFYREHDIELRLETRVERIDPAAKTLTVAGGQEIGWSALLLAMGAAPVRLPVAGAKLDHVFTLRSLRDARSIIDTAGRARRAVVVGASFIGLEVEVALESGDPAEIVGWERRLRAVV